MKSWPSPEAFPVPREPGTIDQLRGTVDHQQSLGRSYLSKTQTRPSPSSEFKLHDPNMEKTLLALVSLFIGRIKVQRDTPTCLALENWGNSVLNLALLISTFDICYIPCTLTNISFHLPTHTMRKVLCTKEELVAQRMGCEGQVTSRSTQNPPKPLMLPSCCKPLCPKWIQGFAFHGHFHFREESKVTRCQIQRIR